MEQYPVVDVTECGVEGLAAIVTGCTVRGFAKEGTSEVHRSDDMEWTVKVLMAAVTDCIVKNLLPMKQK